MRNECLFFYFFTSLRAGMPNRSITKTILEDHALGQCFSTVGLQMSCMFKIEGRQSIKSIEIY